VRVKLYALYLGPSGFGVISQFITFITLITSTIHIGTPFSLSALLPSLYKNDDIPSKQKIYSYFVFFAKLFGSVTLFISVLVILFSDQISFLLVDSKTDSLFLKIIALSIPFIVIYSIFEAFLRSSGQINKIVKIAIFSNLISLPCLIVLINFFLVDGIGIYLLVLGILPFIFMLVLYKRIFTSEYRKKSDRLKTEEIKNIFKTGITSLLAFLFYQLVILYLRKFIISNFGNDENGIYQSVLGLSLNIFAFIYSFLGNHTLQQLSMDKETSKIGSILDNTSKFLIFMIVPIIVLFFGFRELIIILFYSKSFVSGGGLMVYQFLGDGFRVFASLFSLWLFSNMRIKQLIIIDLIFNITLLSLPNVLLLFFPGQLKIVPISYLLASALQFLLFFLYTKSALKFKFLKKTRITILFSVFIVLSSLFVSIKLPAVGPFYAIITLLIWVIVSYRFIENMPFSDLITKLKIKIAEFKK